MQRITEHVFLGTNMRGCNSGAVVTSAGVVLVDTPMVPAEAKAWRREVEQYGEIKYVINNEPHRDHVAGSCWMGGMLVTSEGTRQGIAQNTREALEAQFQWWAPDALPLGEDFYYRLPDITFTGNLNLYMGKHTIHILDMPGHTPTMTAVYVPEERVVFTADNLVWEMPIMFEATPYGWLESLEKLEKLDVDKVVPGHGDVCDKARIKVMRDDITYLIDSVKQGIAKGWGVKEIQERVPFSDRFSLDWGDIRELLNKGVAHLYALETKER
jgi:cyclase